MKRRGCRLPPWGPKRAASIAFQSTPWGTGSSRKLRQVPTVFIASISSMVCSHPCKLGKQRVAVLGEEGGTDALDPEQLLLARGLAPQHLFEHGVACDGIGGLAFCAGDSPLAQPLERALVD